MPTHYQGPPDEVLALDTFVKLVRSADAVFQRLQEGLADAGITQAQLAVLEALLHVGPMSQGELARKLLRSPSNTTGLLHGLEARDLVVRCRRTDDRRVVDVALTEPGRSLISALFPGHARRVAEAFAGLTAEEQASLGALCKKLGRSIQKSHEPVGGRDVRS